MPICTCKIGGLVMSDGHMTETEYLDFWVDTWAKHTGKTPEEIRELALVKEREKANENVRSVQKAKR